MKRIIAVLLIALFMTGCTPSEIINNDLNSSDTTPNSAVNISPSISETTQPTPNETVTVSPSITDKIQLTPNELVDTGSDNPNANTEKNYTKKTYAELKAEFENNIEQARQEPVDDYDVFLYHEESRIIFEEMLNRKQSLEDFNGSIEYPHEKYSGYNLSIDVGSVFTDGKTTYRILMFTAHRYINRRMYIQIYDEESITSQLVFDYMAEGGLGGETSYCGFIQDLGKNYLIIIHRSDDYSVGTFQYYLVNYEIDGKEIRIYNAVNGDFSKGIWTVSEINNDNKEHYEITSTKIVCYDRAFWIENWLDLKILGSQEFFEDNILTIILNNESKDEISLLFKDGFWEVIAVK